MYEAQSKKTQTKTKQTKKKTEIESHIGTS